MDRKLAAPSARTHATISAHPENEPGPANDTPARELLRVDSEATDPGEVGRGGSATDARQSSGALLNVRAVMAHGQARGPEGRGPACVNL